MYCQVIKTHNVVVNMLKLLKISQNIKKIKISCITDSTKLGRQSKEVKGGGSELFRHYQQQETPRN